MTACAAGLILGPAGCVAAGAGVAGVDAAGTAANACLGEPSPDDPHGGVGELLAPKPAGPSKDPFTGDPPPSIYQRYGYGGMFVPVYDLGCVKAVGVTPLNTVSNLNLRGQVWLDALANFFHRAGQTQAWWDALDPVVASSQILAQRLLWGPRGIISLALAALCLHALRRGRNGEPSVVAHIALVALGVLALGHITAFRGVETTHWLRDHLVEFTTAFDGGTGASDVEGRQLRYRTWASAMFGDADSPVAKEYAPQMLECFAYRWDDPQTVAKQTEKQACVHRLMDDLSANHPAEAAYAHGEKTTEQLFTTTLGFWLGSVPVALWRFVEGLCGITLFMAATLSVIVVSFVVPIAFFKAKEVLWPIFNRVAGLLLMTCACQLIAQVVASAEGTLLATQSIPWLLRLVFCAAVVVVFWIFGKQFRKPMNGWVENKVAAGTGHVVKGTVQAAEFAAAMSAGIPPGVAENMGKKPKGLDKDGKDAKNTAPAAAVPSFQAPPVDPTAAARKQALIDDLGLGGKHTPPAPPGRPPPPPAANTGPGMYRTGTDTWATSDTGVTPTAALGSGVFALPPSSGVTHDPVIHGEQRRRLVQDTNRTFPDTTADRVGIDAQLAGMFVIEGRRQPAVDARSWVAPAPTKPSGDQS